MLSAGPAPLVGLMVREAAHADRAAVREVLETAFGQPAEANLVEALEREGSAVVSLVAVLEGAVVGHVMLSLLDAPMPALALAPLAVAPPHRRRGVGRSLVTAALDEALARGWAAVLVLGEPAYYGPLGFEAARDYSCKYAGEHLMLRVLTPPVPAHGRIVYPPAFDRL